VDDGLEKIYVPSKYSQNISISLCWNVCSAIIIVPTSVVKKNGTTGEEVLACLKEMARLPRPEAENHGSDVKEILANEDLTALLAEVVNEEGIEEDSEPEEEDTMKVKS